MKQKIKTELDLFKFYEDCHAQSVLKIYLKDGSTVTGKPYAYTSSVNNTPEVPEIDIKHEDGHLSAWYLEEIDSIEVLKEDS